MKTRWNSFSYFIISSILSVPYGPILNQKGYQSDFRAYVKLKFDAKPMFENGSKSGLSELSCGAWDY